MCVLLGHAAHILFLKLIEEGINKPVLLWSFSHSRNQGKMLPFYMVCLEILLW